MRRRIDRALSGVYRFAYPALDSLGLTTTIEATYERARIASGFYDEVDVVVCNSTFTFLTEPGAAADVERFLTEDESAVLEDMWEHLDDDDVVFDIGGGIGYYTVIAASKASDGEVHAFEPNVRNTVRIEKHASMSGTADRVSTHRVALTDKADSESSWIANHRISGIQHTSGDRLVAFKSLPTPNVVKMDIQGAELDAIRGLTETLSRPECRLVYVEVHADEDIDYSLSEPEQASLEDTLRNCGFTVERFDEKDHEYFVRAMKE